MSEFDDLSESLEDDRVDDDDNNDDGGGSVRLQMLVLRRCRP